MTDNIHKALEPLNLTVEAPVPPVLKKHVTAIVKPWVDELKADLLALKNQQANNQRACERIESKINNTPQLINPTHAPTKNGVQEGGIHNLLSRRYTLLEVVSIAMNAVLIMIALWGFFVK
jgi:hypothetical protein